MSAPKVVRRMYCLRWMRDLLDIMHESLKCALPHHYFVTPPIEDTRKEGRLELEHTLHPLLDAPSGNEIDDAHGLALPVAVHPPDALFEDRRIPRQIEIHDDRGALQIEAHATRVGREKHFARRILAKFVKQIFALAARDTAVQMHKADTAALQLRLHKPRHPLPLAENHHLFLTALERIVEDMQQLVDLRVISRFLVEDIRAVGKHPHAIERDHKTLPVFFIEESEPFPLVHQSRAVCGIFFMPRRLHFGHGDEHVSVGTLRQFLEHVFFSAADDDILKNILYFVEFSIARNFAILVPDLVRLEKAIHRSKPIWIDERKNGVEFLEFVFDWRAGEHDCILACNALHIARKFRVPVFDPLRLVENDRIEMRGIDRREIRAYDIVVCDRIRGVRVVLPVASPWGSLDAHGTVPRKFFYLVFPLIFE